MLLLIMECSPASLQRRPDIEEVRQLQAYVGDKNPGILIYC
jgi:hypothetical protein